MVQGCSSSAGKSYLTAALCRIYARRGVRVAPFKAQNMSNNAGVTPAGLEMGRAQLTQAHAAGVTPDVRMNPVLIKPEGDTRSQVVVLGKRDETVARLPWTDRKTALWPVVQRSLHSLLSEFELVVIEGAGSPAEVNLKAGDIVNMRVALEAQARVLLCADIDRGGAFAHLLGTWACLDEDERASLLGFVLNKFRGDPKLLGGGTGWLRARTNVPTLGVVPYLPLTLPEEDAHTLQVGTESTTGPDAGLQVAVLKLPTVSNFDEFDALAHEPGVSLRWVDAPEALTGAGLIILPGSKHVAADAAWLGRTGLSETVKAHAQAGTPILGVCGGLQLLGERVNDPHGVEEGEGSSFAGLGLLGLDTTLETEKVTRQTTAELLSADVKVSGYEIHHGQSRARGETKPYLSDGLGFRRKNVTGVYLHGLFEDTAFRRAFLGALGVQSSDTDRAAALDKTLETLADHVEAHLDTDTITDAVFKPSKPRRSQLILVTGGVRSGKSRYAEALVTHFLGRGENALYLATLAAGDDEMTRRIETHRARRPESWRTLETPFSPAAAIAESSEEVILLDCLSGLVSNILLAHEHDGEAVTQTVLDAVNDLIQTVRAGRKTLVIVTNEVGSGVVPAYPLGRLYRDALGLANARVAAAADAVALCVVGLPQTLKGTLPEVSLD